MSPYPPPPSLNQTILDYLLSDEQKKTIKTIQDSSKKTFLILGVTASGKNLKVKSNGYVGETTLLEISLTNLSSVPLKLSYIGDYTFHQYSDFLEVPAKKTITVQALMAEE